MRIIARRETAKRASEQRQHKAQSSRHARSNRERTEVASPEFLPLPAPARIGDGFQRQEAQQRHCHLRHHQYGGNRPELVVEREILIEELGKAHEIVTPGQQYGENRRRQQGPFVGTLHNEAAQQEEQAHYCAHIDRSRRERLLTPIGRKRADQLGSIAAVHPGAHQSVVHLRIAADIVIRASSHVIGNQQGKGLVNAIAPGSGVLYVEAFGSLLPFCHKVGMSSSHGLLHVFGIRLECAVASPYTHREGQREHCHRNAQVLEALLLDMQVELRYAEEPHHHEKIIGHLRMLHHPY